MRNKRMLLALALTVTVAMTLATVALAVTGYLVIPPDGPGMLGDNEITVTAAGLTAGECYRIKWQVIYVPNPRTPPGAGESPPDGYGGEYLWCEDGTEESLTVNALLSDCHWQPDAQFALYYSPTGDLTPPYWQYITGSAGETTRWYDCSGDGCTPVYWRNFDQHYDEWLLTPYRWDDDFDTTFGVDLFDPDKTLGETIWLGGGGVKKLARHGTAALLSAAHPGVDFPLSVAEVIAAVQAGDSGTLADLNELGCPLD
jgi:hypothetical protein